MLDKLCLGMSNSATGCGFGASESTMCITYTVSKQKHIKQGLCVDWLMKMRPEAGRNLTSCFL